MRLNHTSTQTKDSHRVLLWSNCISWTWPKNLSHINPWPKSVQTAGNILIFQYPSWSNEVFHGVGSFRKLYLGCYRSCINNTQNMHASFFNSGYPVDMKIMFQAYPSLCLCCTQHDPTVLLIQDIYNTYNILYIIFIL